MRFGAHFGYIFIKAKPSACNPWFPALYRIKYISCLGRKNKFVCQLNQEVLFCSLIAFQVIDDDVISGCHLVHQEIVQVPELYDYKVGMTNVFCKYFATRFNSHSTLITRTHSLAAYMRLS